MLNTSYQIGEPVVYRAQKRSSSPGPRAKNVRPARHGEDYFYEVPKYWVVEFVGRNGILIARTRRGKQRLIDTQDARLRRAHWWERLFLHDRFPHLESCRTGYSS
jgi:hypothetical protein